MPRRRRKLTLADRRERAERNQRRGRQPQTTVPLPAERARYYRYGGVIVRACRGRLDALRVFSPKLGRHVVAAAHPSLEPLPKRERSRVRSQAEDADRRARLADMGVQLPDGGVARPDAPRVSP